MSNPMLRYIDLQRVRWVAMRHGYAISIHGSCKRDIDLIATPWVIEASRDEKLVEAIAIAVDGYLENSTLQKPNPSIKPHGRKAWVILLPGKPTYIDISVMPNDPNESNFSSRTILAGLKYEKLSPEKKDLADKFLEIIGGRAI